MTEFFNIALNVAFGIFAAIAVAFIIILAAKKEKNNKQKVENNG